MRAPGTSRAVGITSTVPSEILFAAGLRPLDLNNRFVTHPERARLLEEAEAAGFPLSMCAWIKGIYALAARGEVSRVVGVTQGDCSNTHLLLEILEDDGIEVLPFEYPLDRDPGKLERSMRELAAAAGTTLGEAEDQRRRLRALRERLERLDELTWRELKVTGRENYLWLINSSDFRGDPDEFARELDGFLREAERRPPRKAAFRLGLAGIPPIVDGLHECFEERGAAVVFNEFPRQFSMPGEYDSLVEQYLAYTYPYGTPMRVDDINREAGRRGLDGLVHDIQSFCYRQLQDRMIRSEVELPVLRLEFDRPGTPDGRSLTRMEAFLELLEERRAASRESSL